MSSPQLRSVLLVDDDTISNLFNTIFIGRLHFDIAVYTATHGGEAMALLADRQSKLPRPCLLLLDIRMPVMDGWEFLKAYATLDEELRKGIVIGVLTTSRDERKKIKALKNQYVSAVLEKPLSEGKLARLLKKLFDPKKTSG